MKDVLGPNLAELKKYAKEKEKREAEAKRRLEKAKPMLEKLKKEREEAEKNEYKPKEITQDESGRLIDEKGNVINLNVIFSLLNSERVIHLYSPSKLLLSKSISTKIKNRESKIYSNFKEALA